MGQAPRGHGAGRAWGTGGGRWGRRDRDGTGTPSPLTPQGRGGAQAPTNTPCLGLLRRGTRTPGLPWGGTRRGDTRPQPPQVTSGGEAPPAPLEVTCPPPPLPPRTVPPRLARPTDVRPSTCRSGQRSGLTAQRAPQQPGRPRPLPARARGVARAAPHGPRWRGGPGSL